MSARLAQAQAAAELLESAGLLGAETADAFLDAQVGAWWGRP